MTAFSTGPSSEQALKTPEEAAPAQQTVDETMGEIAEIDFGAGATSALRASVQLADPTGAEQTRREIDHVPVLADLRWRMEMATAYVNSDDDFNVIPSEDLSATPCL